MAKRRNAIGKKGKHSRDDLGIVIEKTSRSEKKMLLIPVLIVLVLAAVLIVAYYFLVIAPQPDEEKEVLTTGSAQEGGYPDEEITFGFTVYNPKDKDDIFAPLVSGLPSDWETILPNPITVEGGKSEDDQFSVIPSPFNSMNKTYSFMLNVTSGNTQHTYTIGYKLTVYQSYGVELLCYNNSHDADPGRSTYYGFLVKNTGNGDDTISLSYDDSHLPDNWSLSFDSDSIDIPALGSGVVICNITTDSNTSKGIYNITIIATSSGSETASIWLNTSLTKDFENKTVELEDKIQVDYIGYFTDGEIFDTSYFYVANNTDYPKNEIYKPRDLDEYVPLKIAISNSNIGSYVSPIDGFWEGAIGMEVNETRVLRIPSEKGYNDGKTRIFEITVISMDE